MGDPGNLSSRFRDLVGVPPVAVVPGTCLWLLKERMLLLQHQWKRPWSPTGLWEGGLGIGKATLGAIGGGGAITRKKERSQEEEEEQSVAA
ncbi:hypothetical protein BHM03_00047818 [Ensete ventricosum]|nr:hypothetical protein BHM03_00047818 [Ensete ventricosum]